MTVDIDFLGFDRHIRTGEYSCHFKLTDTVHHFYMPLIQLVESSQNENSQPHESFLRAARNILQNPEALKQLKTAIKRKKNLSALSKKGELERSLQNLTTQTVG